MIRLIRLFLKEEIRRRRSFSTSLSLLVFPEIIMIGALAGYLFLPLLAESISYKQVHLGLLSGLMLFGISMGGVAFLGKEFMERSIGPINMLVTSSRYFPVSQKRMYIGYFLHDLVFYAVLILIPITSGLAVGTMVRPLPIWRFILISAAQWSSFLLGISLSMLVSSALGGHNKWKWVVIPAALVPLFIFQLLTGDISAFVPPDLAVDGWGWAWIVVTVLLSFLYAIAGIFLFQGDRSTFRRGVPGEYGKMRRFLSRFTRDRRFSALLARDLMNLIRGKAYVRIGFSLLFPLVVMGGLVGIISGIDSKTLDFNLPFFAVMVSFFTMSIYANLVNMDFLEFDQTIPVRTNELIRVKLSEHMMIAIPVTIIFLGVVAVIKEDFTGLLYALPLAFVMVPYMGYVTAYLTGLWTNSMLFDASVFLRYLAFTVFPLMMATLMSFLMGGMPSVSLVGMGLIILSGIVSTIFLARSLDEKWADTALASAGSSG